MSFEKCCCFYPNNIHDYFEYTLKHNGALTGNGENVPRLEITKVVLMHCDIVSNDYHQDSRVLYKFVPNKSFGQ